MVLGHDALLESCPSYICASSLHCRQVRCATEGAREKDENRAIGEVVRLGVRFVQFFRRGWDQHEDLPRDIALQCQSTDQPAAALVTDLKQRGLLDETLVIWGGESGRTVFSQGIPKPDNYVRDHHGRCFTMWLAGGGSRRAHSQTDDFSYDVAHVPVAIHDLNATILHLLGIDHKRLTYRFQGRDYRLTDVYGNVVDRLMA